VLTSTRSTYASLAIRDFRYLWLGTGFGHVAFWMQIVAQGWLAYELTGSATFLGIIGAANGIPGILLMLPAGVIADRWERRGVLIWTNAAMALGALALTWTVWRGILEPWMLVVIVVFIASASAINLPARQSLGPQLVGPALVSNSIALMAVSFNASRWIGPGLAGVLIASVGAMGAFGIQTALMVLATILTAWIDDEPARDLHARRQSVLENLLDGLRYTWEEPIVRSAVIISILHNAFGAAYHHLMPVFAGEEIFNIGPSGLGALMASIGVGATIGAVASSYLSGYQRKGLAIFATATIAALGMLAFASAPLPVLAMTALVVVGCVQTLSMTANQMILNLATPDEYRGRAMSVFMLTWSVAPIAALPAGAAADVIGAPLTVAISGALSLGAFLIGYAMMAGLRGFRDAAYQVPPVGARAASPVVRQGAPDGSSGHGTG
jgi:predicted MFS family arabinose efflux permease